MLEHAPQRDKVICALKKKVVKRLISMTRYTIIRQYMKQKKHVCLPKFETFEIIARV